MDVIPPMSSLQFLADFKALHERAKLGTLTPSERAKYAEARVQFSRFVVVAQQLGHAGKTLRADLRMTKMLKVEVRPDEGEPAKCATIDLASGGFAVLMSVGMLVGKTAAFTLHLPRAGGGADPISGRCKVASCRSQTGLFRVSFAFELLLPDVKEKLDGALIDAVLERLAPL
jgi:hypothetical protein